MAVMARKHVFFWQMCCFLKGVELTFWEGLFPTWSFLLVCVSLVIKQEKEEVRCNSVDSDTSLTEPHNYLVIFTTQYSIHCTVYTTQYYMHYTLHSALYNSLYSMNYNLNFVLSLHCTVCNIHLI